MTRCSVPDAPGGLTPDGASALRIRTDQKHRSRTWAWALFGGWLPGYGTVRAWRSWRPLLRAGTSGSEPVVFQALMPLAFWANVQISMWLAQNLEVPVGAAGVNVAPFLPLLVIAPMFGLVRAWPEFESPYYEPDREGCVDLAADLWERCRQGRQVMVQHLVSPAPTHPGDVPEAWRGIVDGTVAARALRRAAKNVDGTPVADRCHDLIEQLVAGFQCADAEQVTRLVRSNEVSETLAWAYLSESGAPWTGSIGWATPSVEALVGESAAWQTAKRLAPLMNAVTVRTMLDDDRRVVELVAERLSNLAGAGEWRRAEEYAASAAESVAVLLEGCAVLEALNDIDGAWSQQPSVLPLARQVRAMVGAEAASCPSRVDLP